MKYQNIELHNVCDIIDTPGEAGITTSRLPADVRPNVNEGAQNNSMHGSGVEIRGMLPEGGKAKVVLQILDDNCVPPVAMVYHGCFSSQAIHVGFEPTEITIGQPNNIEAMQRITAEQNLPFDARLVRICLPAIHPVRIVSIEGDLTYPAPDATPERTMLCYGSSITHGAHAIAPHSTYAAQCANKLGVDLINLGVGGSAQMDAAYADHIAGREDWDFATFEMGINVRQWPIEKFRAAVDNFVTTIAQAHPDKYLFCIDLFTNDQDYAIEQQSGIGFREVVQAIAEKQNSPRVIHIDGRTLLTRPGGLQVDLVHPNDNGFQEMGTRLAEFITRTMK